VERLQGGPIDERVLKHKLLMTLPTVHREVGLNKMASVGYHELLHELIQLDRVRQLANAHRKTGHQANNPKFINAVDTNNNAFVDRPPSRPRGNKGPGKPRRWSCLRCLDTVDPPGHHHRNCPSPNPVEKDGRCVHCNRTIGSGKNCCQDPTRCTASTNRRCPRCSAEGKHHPFHCPGPLPTTSTEASANKTATTTLTFENVLIAGTTTQVSTSPLRSTTLQIAGKAGPVPITGLIDTGAEMTAVSQATIDRLIQSGVEVPHPKAICTAIMADGKPLKNGPIHDMVFIHGHHRISAPVVVIKDLSKDVLVSAHLFRQFTDPTIWLFSKNEDRLLNIGSLDPELKSLWDAFYSRLLSSRPVPTSESSSSSDQDSQEDKLVSSITSNKDDIHDLPHSPIICGVTIEDFTADVIDEDQCLNAVSTVDNDPSALADTSSPSRYKHTIKWLKPKPTNNVEAFRKLAEKLESRLRRDGIFHLYDAEIEKFRQKGYIKPISPKDAKFCLNHFPVVRKHGNELSSMKVRPVFDGSSLRGIVSPNLTDIDKQHVTSSIYLLRRFPYFISCDFQAAFLQVEYALEEDRRHLCFWWRNVLYSYQRVLFGLPDSPGALIHALNDNLAESFDELHHTVQVDNVANYGVRILMDDLSVAASSRHLVHQVLSVVLSNANKRGFEENEAKRVESHGTSKKSGSMLGYHWSADDDTLSISATRESESRPLVTVDDYRRFLATFFDPCGLYLEHLMKARLHLQQVALAGKASALCPKQLHVIEQWVYSLRQTPSSPRQLYPTNVDYDTIIAYIDASNKASAIVVETLTGRRIWARGFVTPAGSSPTAPRMELDALCVASTLLRDFITDIADYWGVTKLVICTDSEVNLARLRRSPTIIKTPDELVKQRRLVKIRNNVHELQKKTQVRVFFTHIDGELNPADPPSRGKLGNNDGLSQRLTYISQLVALLEDPGIYSLENLPAFYVVPGDNEPIPIPSKITTKPTKIAINNTIIDDDGGDEITGYDTDDIATLLYHQRRLAQTFQEWQESSLNLEDPDHEQPPILSSLVRVIRSAQYRFGRQRLLRLLLAFNETHGSETGYCLRKMYKDTTSKTCYPRIHCQEDRQSTLVKRWDRSLRRIRQ
ncbi:hypothetical protein FOZ62_027824, partial [Perkinsus olseni]